MRILHIAETAKGGVGTYLNHIVPLQCAALGCDAVRLIVPADHSGQLSDVEPSQIISFTRPRRSAASLLTLARTIVSVVKQFEPDVIHAHSTFAGALARLIYGWRPRRPALVYCPHGWAFNIQAAAWKQNLVALAERLMAPLCDSIVAISDFEAEEAIRIGIPQRKITTIRNGIPLDPPPCPNNVDWPDPRRKILFVGRLDRQKGYDVLEAALNGLQGDVTARVAGAAVVTTPPVSETKSVEFLGWLSPPDIEAHLRCADVLVMPSRWEGFGLTALEAMRAGKPVIASAVGGLPELVADGVTGRLVPPENVPALRRALLADSPQVLRAMGEQGRQRFRQNFSIDHTHAGLLRLYQEIKPAPDTSSSSPPSWQ
jgi:glycosyltransferase involved in cell wall biosynthesis